MEAVQVEQQVVKGETNKASKAQTGAYKKKRAKKANAPFGCRIQLKSMQDPKNTIKETLMKCKKSKHMTQIEFSQHPDLLLS